MALEVRGNPHCAFCDEVVGAHVNLGYELHQLTLDGPWVAICTACVAATGLDEGK